MKKEILTISVLVAFLFTGACFVSFRIADGIVNHRVENRASEYMKEVKK